jgi:hypothetical protein
MICAPYHILFGDQIKEVEMVRWAEHIARVGEKESGYKVLVRKPERKGRLGTPWH